MRRIRCNEDEAVTLWEETGKGTREASRGKGPGAYGGIAEITSGRTHVQQGLVTTCKDPSTRLIAEGEGRVIGLAHESVGAKKEG